MKRPRVGSVRYDPVQLFGIAALNARVLADGRPYYG